MSETPSELLALVKDTQKAIKRADAALEELGGSVVFADMVDATAKFRTVLAKELEQLEAALGGSTLS